MFSAEFGTTSSDSQPPPFEGTHNFTKFPSSHVDIEADQVTFIES